MTEVTPLRRALSAFTCGLHFAVLQASYFFLVEAFLSAGHLPYFAVSLAWLAGVLAGLATPAGVSLTQTTVCGTGTYVIAHGALGLFPFQDGLSALTYGCIALSGLTAGHFVAEVARGWPDRTAALLHENNGFVVGLAVALVASTTNGTHLLEVGPLGTAALVLAFRVPRPA